MNQDELIEAIVKEVKKMLALKGIDVASSTAASAPAKEPAPEAAAPAVSTQPMGKRDVSGKQIITQSDLESFTGQTITVAKKAVITPLALDYARAKGITITRADKTTLQDAGSGQAKSGFTIALAVAPDFPADSMFVKKFLASKGIQIKEITGASYEAAVTNLSRDVVTGGSSFGVCIEKSGMLGPIHANRNMKIRAVHCRETMDARAARVDFGANVVVIDSVSNPEAVLAGFLGF